MANELKEWKRVLEGLPGDEVYQVTEPLDGVEFLDLMEQRRRAFWNSKPDNEKSHYQGYSAISREQLINSLRRQTHAELAAVHAPNLSFNVCPWQETKMDYARQMNEEGRHFNLIREHLLDLGGSWDDDYSPDFPEWNTLFNLFLTLENRYFLDPAKEVVARASVLNFGIEGWDHLYVQPTFLKFISNVDETLAQIYEEIIMPDETFHYSIGQRILRDHCDRPDLQRVAVYFIDRGMVAHHAVNVAFPAYHKRQGFRSE
jgi:uncharacterized ferritin-like protein (DUF455 family)